MENMNLKKIKYPVVNKDYIDYYNREYKGLKELAFKRNESIYCLGKTTNTNYREDHRGTFILRNKDNPNVAYKIDEGAVNYQNFDNFQWSSFISEPRFIFELQKRQSLIKRTDFPTGIVTVDHYCIGEEIPYYNNAITLTEFTKLEKNKFLLPTDLYLNLLESLKELADNNIYYCDIHNKNFVVFNDEKTNKETIKIIDFSSDYVNFELFKTTLQTQTQNLKKSINQSLENLSIPEKITLSEENPIEDAMEKVMKLGQIYR